MLNFINMISILFVFSNKGLYKNNGYDYRFGNETCDYAKLNSNFNKYKLLKKLESNISIIEKTKLAQEYLEEDNIKTFDIFAGGLMNEWNFGVIFD